MDNMSYNEPPKYEDTLPVEIKIEEPPKYEDTLPVENTFYKPNKLNWAPLRKAFDGDPLAFMTDIPKRAELEAVTSRYDDPKTKRKELALAAYFAHRHDLDINYCMGNLRTFLDKFGDKPLSVDQAYDIIGVALNGRAAPVGAGEKVGQAISEHVSAFAAGAVDTAAEFTAAILKGAVVAEDLRQRLLKPLLPNFEWQQKVVRGAEKIGTEWVREGNREVSDLLKNNADMNPNFLMDLLDEKKRKNARIVALFVYFRLTFRL